MSIHLNKSYSTNKKKEEITLAANNFNIGAKLGVRDVEVATVKINGEKFTALKKLGFLKKVWVGIKNIFSKESKEQAAKKESNFRKVLKNSFALLNKELQEKNHTDNQNKNLQTLILKAVSSWKIMQAKELKKKNSRFSLNFLNKTSFQHDIEKGYNKNPELIFREKEVLKGVVKEKTVEKHLPLDLLRGKAFAEKVKKYSGVLPINDLQEDQVKALLKLSESERIQVWKTLKASTITRLVLDSFDCLFSKIDRKKSKKTFFHEILEHAFKVDNDFDFLFLFKSQTLSGLTDMDKDLKKVVYPKLPENLIKSVLKEGEKVDAKDYILRDFYEVMKGDQKLLKICKNLINFENFLKHFPKKEQMSVLETFENS